MRSFTKTIQYSGTLLLFTKQIKDNNMKLGLPEGNFYADLFEFSTEVNSFDSVGP